jgi:uncharacterized membrane protein
MDWIDYNWVRAIHLIAVIAWMAGMLIYPRLLVYRLEAQGDERFEAAMDKAANATRKIIVNPTMILTWAAGTSCTYSLGSGAKLRWCWSCPASMAGSLAWARRSPAVSARSSRRSSACSTRSP